MGQNVGALYIRGDKEPDEASWAWLGEARGRLTVPSGKEARLIVDVDACADLSHLDALAPNALQELDLSNSEVDDNALFHIKRLTSLKRVNIRNTRITEAALAELKKALPNCLFES